LPKTMKELKGLEFDKTTLERVKKARANAWKWRKRQDEKQSFNNDQNRAQELNSV